MSYEPDILGFACNWCGYAGADGAGQAKLQYPANIRIIRVMCLGRVDPSFMLRAFEDGYDGVALIGCHLGDCHYVSGNVSAREVVGHVQGILDTMGLGRSRLRIEEASASEGPVFAQVVRTFKDELVAMGPNPLKKGRPTLGEEEATP
ncbi:MAG: hydrogenase iron-sulfur subunit [Pseudomonadota bacterium]